MNKHRDSFHPDCYLDLDFGRTQHAPTCPDASHGSEWDEHEDKGPGVTHFKDDGCEISKAPSQEPELQLARPVDEDSLSAVSYGRRRLATEAEYSGNCGAATVANCNCGKCCIVEPKSAADSKSVQSPKYLYNKVEIYTQSQSAAEAQLPPWCQYCRDWHSEGSIPDCEAPKARNHDQDGTDTNVATPLEGVELEGICSLLLLEAELGWVLIREAEMAQTTLKRLMTNYC